MFQIKISYSNDIKFCNSIHLIYDIQKLIYSANFGHFAKYILKEVFILKEPKIQTFC